MYVNVINAKWWCRVQINRSMNASEIEIIKVVTLFHIVFGVPKINNICLVSYL